VNDYKELQKIYEGYPAPNNIGPNAKYAPGEAPPGYTLYRAGQLPAGGRGVYNAYELGQSGQYAVPTAVVVAGDEEKPIPPAEIINLDVLEKLEELQKEADEDGMNYALEQLSRLKEHIISLSQ
tara:strand:- start:82 stop:453 length:372 start_codon:yes stop_codon:yes gene_type:complete